MKRTMWIPYVIMFTLAMCLSAFSTEPDPQEWTWNWSWTAPDPAMPNTEHSGPSYWFYGWDSTSNGFAPADGVELATRKTPVQLDATPLNTAVTINRLAKTSIPIPPMPILPLLALASIGTISPTGDVAIVKTKFADCYGAGRFTVSPFCGVTLAHIDEIDGRLFTGLGVAYGLARNVELAGEAALDDTDEQFIDNFGAFGRAYLPVWRSGFALYGELGWKRYTRDDDIDFLSTGAGVAFRGKHGGVRLGARRLDDLNGLGLWELLVAAEIEF